MTCSTAPWGNFTLWRTFSRQACSTEMQKRWKDDLLFSRIRHRYLFTCSLLIWALYLIFYVWQISVKLMLLKTFYWLGSSHLRFCKTRKEWIIAIKSFNYSFTRRWLSRISVNTDFSIFIPCLLQVGEVEFTDYI